MGNTQTEPLVILRIEIEFGSWPETHIEEQIGLAGLAKVITGIEAVGAAVRRVKSWLALKDFNRVDMNSPVLLFGRLFCLLFDWDRRFTVVTRAFCSELS